MQTRSKNTEGTASRVPAATFGQLVVWWRESFRLTQEALARRARLPQSLVSQVESDQIDSLSPDILGPLTKTLLRAARDLSGAAESSPPLDEEETIQIAEAFAVLQSFVHSTRRVCE